MTRKIQLGGLGVQSRFAETRFAEKIVLRIFNYILVLTFCYCNNVILCTHNIPSMLN